MKKSGMCTSQPLFLELPVSHTPFKWHKNAQLITANGDIVTRTDVLNYRAQTDTVPLSDQSAALKFIFHAIEHTSNNIIIGGNTVSVQATATRPMLHCHTGGTTAQPKRIARDFETWALSFQINRDRFAPNLGAIATLGHLSHSLTLYAACEAIVLGLRYVSGMGHNKVINFFNEHGVHVLYATPTQIRLLALRERKNGLMDLRHVMIGGGKLDQTTRSLVQRLAPNATIWQFYGAAETSFITISDDTCPPDSVGSPFDGVDIKLDNIDQVSGIGDIWVKSPYLFNGYSQGSSPDTYWDNGWLTIGEQGWLDGDGNLYIAGRKSRMITIADKNVFPEDIEAIAYAHEGIEACAALPQHDDLRGARMVLFVCAPNDAVIEPLTKAFLTGVPSHMRPTRIIRVAIDDWPVLASGKPDLKLLTTLLG